MVELPSLIRERIRAKLAAVRLALEQAGFTTTMFDAMGDRPVPTLVVNLDPDEEKRPRALEVNLMPLGPDEADATDFLQFYLRLPFRPGEGNVAEVQQAATVVNNHLAVGHFGVNARGEIFFRYVLATPLGGMPDPGLLKELVAFLAYSQLHFGDYLEGVCEDEISLLVLEDVIHEGEREPLA